MHDKVSQILRSYPFSYSPNYRDFGYEKIADSVQELRQTPKQFFELSERIRKIGERSQPEKVDQFVQSEFLTERQKINLLGLMSFSSNGFVRHAALKALSRFKTAYIFPFVLLRLQDWVDPIRELAESLFQPVSALATPKDWEACALLINRISERNHGRHVQSLVHAHLRDRFSAENRAGWFLSGHKEIRQLLWGLFSDQDLEQVATPSFISSESDPKLAGEVFQLLIKILSRDMVLDAGIRHSSNRIRYAALQALYDLDGPELRTATQDALSDKSANVRDLARFIYNRRFGIHPREHYKDFNLAPDNETAKLGYVMGWLESSRAEPDRFLEFFYQSPRGRIRGAALMAYARVAGYTEKSADLIIEALEGGSHPRDVAAKLIKMGWASGISDKLWEIADRETDLPRKMRLYRLAAQSDWQNALLPALRRMSDPVPVIRQFLLEIVEKWSRLCRVPDLTEAEKTEGRALVKSLTVGRHKKDWLNFLFL